LLKNYEISTRIMENTERIYGDEIFFAFMEYEYDAIDKHSDLIKKIRTKELDGFIVRNLLSTAEVEQIKSALETLPTSALMLTPSGKIFPNPFATITNSVETLDTYYKKLAILQSFRQENNAIDLLLGRLNTLISMVGADYDVSIPSNKLKDKAVAPGTFRFFFPNMGGLHVHCGNLFQTQSMFFYSLIKNNIDMDDQLSYFIVLQQSEEGGELTIYDMLWQDVKRKESPENNEFVIADNNQKIYMNTQKSFAVRPKPGDILIFSGGPIWHRVEDIKGESPRITFGGFLNFSKDDKELYYWS
jgi:hypothetical protein